MSGGISNISILDKDSKVKIKHYYEPLPAFSVKGFIIEPVGSKRYSFEQGLSLETFGAEHNTPWDLYNDIKKEMPDYEFEQSYNKRTFQITVPLLLRYNFEKWLVVHTGINNVFYLKQEQHMVTNWYTLRGEIGFDIIIKNLFIVGANGTYDLTPSGRYVSYDIFNRYYSATLKLGYILN